LFRRQIGELALHLALAGDVVLPQRSSYPEVQQPREAVNAHEHVVGRDIAVNQSQRLAGLAARCVGCPEAQEHAVHDAQGNAAGHGAVGVAKLEQLRQGYPLDIVHDDVQLAVLVEQIQGLNHVGMLYPSHDPGLVEKAGHQLGVLSQMTP